MPFIFLVAGYCGWIFTLPLFPSLDGPMHLYYASVLGSLLSGSKLFSSYYFIRHILPPYALHYYFLIANAHFVGYLMADKLLVCLIFVTVAFGFRYLACQMGPGGDVFSFLSVPLLLTWPLGMGFYNYFLAIGMGLWALGMWYRAVDRRSHRLWIGFLFVVILMMLTHPVPTIFLYILVGVDVAWRIFWRMSSGANAHSEESFSWRSFRPDLIYMFAAWSTAGYIALFTGAHRVMGNITERYPRKSELLALAKLSTLAMFSGTQLTVLAYRISLYILLFAAITIACHGLRSRWNTRTIKPADMLLVCSIALLVVIPLLPPVMNGANYFAQRLMILIWFGVLAAASGYTRMTPVKERWAVIGICIYAVLVLELANSHIRPVAARIDQIETGRTYGNGLTGIALSLPNAPDPVDLNYVPYYWAGARYFRRTKSTLLNGGWLYESYLPLGSRLELLTDEFAPSIQDSPGNTYQLLLRSQRVRDEIMPHADVVLFTGRTIPEDITQLVSALDRDEPSRRWNCGPASWYSVCTAPFAK